MPQGHGKSRSWRRRVVGKSESEKVCAETPPRSRKPGRRRGKGGGQRSLRRCHQISTGKACCQRCARSPNGETCWSGAEERRLQNLRARRTKQECAREWWRWPLQTS